MEKETRLQKIAGYLVLILVAVLLLIGLRLGVDAEEGSSAETDGSAPPLRGTAISFHEPAEFGSQANDPSTIPLPVITDNSLVPAPIPRTYEGQKPQHDFEIYTVERGDTPSEIAYQYGIKTETLLGGNPRLSQESSLMQPGMDLIILPLDGVLHDVQQGDTLESVSADYSISVEDIIAYEPNNLEFPYRLYPETQIMVPGAVAEVFVWTPPQLSSVSGGSRRRLLVRVLSFSRSAPETSRSAFGMVILVSTLLLLKDRVFLPLIQGLLLLPDGISMAMET